MNGTEHAPSANAYGQELARISWHQSHPSTARCAIFQALAVVSSRLLHIADTTAATQRGQATAHAAALARFRRPTPPPPSPTE